MKEIETTRRDLLVEVARLYYEQDLSQLEISRRYDISRSSVSNLLKLCRDQGIVEIRINDSSSHVVRMQNALASRFGLAHAVVVPASPDPGLARVHVGRAAAAWLEPRIRDGLRIGISWGTTLYELVRHVGPAAREGIEVVQLHGGLGAGNPDIDGFGLAQKLAEKLPGKLSHHAGADDRAGRGAEAHAPAGAGDRAGAARGAGVDIALFGIGSNIPGISSLVRAGYLREEESVALLSQGAVGTVCGLQIDSQGKALASSVNDRLIGIDRDTLVGIPIRLGAAAGAQKADAVLAALRGGLVTTLVLDEEAAARILAAR